MSSEGQTQILLEGWNEGDTGARDELIARIYPHLRQIAAARLRNERDCSLSTGDLVNDAVIKIIDVEGADINDRAHFMALVARMMRHILVDHVRSKNVHKRHHHKVELKTQFEGGQNFELRSLESALVRLGAINPQLMELVEMRFFGGMTITDIGEVTGLSEATVKRRWQVARAWLADALGNPIG